MTHDQESNQGGSSGPRTQPKGAGRKTPRDASDRTLGLTNIWQVLRKLCWEVELLKAIPAHIQSGTRPVDVLHVQDAKLYAAVNAASTNIALVDWLYHSIRNDSALIERSREVFPGLRTDTDKDFLRSIRGINKSINMCHQICNANKHFHLIEPQSDFKILVGDLVMEQPDGTTKLGVVTHVVQNGEGIEGRGAVDTMLADLVPWWVDVLDRIQLPGRDLFFPGRRNG